MCKENSYGQQIPPGAVDRDIQPAADSPRATVFMGGVAGATPAIPAISAAAPEPETTAYGYYAEAEGSPAAAPEPEKTAYGYYAEDTSDGRESGEMAQPPQRRTLFQGTDYLEEQENIPPAPPARKKEKKFLSRSAVVWLLLLALLVGGGAGVGAGYLISSHLNEELLALVKDSVDQYIAESDATVLYRSVVSENNAEQTPVMDTNSVVKYCADSVVEILTEVVTDYGWFGKALTEGAGSGVIISEDGYIVTCAHVIEGASSITISLRDGSTYEAQVMGSDKESDIAVIKIEAENLPYAVLGNSDSLEVGDPVVAIGNPLGQLGGTVTQGIVSALARQVVISEQSYTLLQTDAAINGGNSGGGLFDAKGELIGIVNAHASEAEGLNFAIPIGSATGIIEDLIKYGYVTSRVTLGIKMINIEDQRTAASFGVSELGVYIYQVAAGSNAEYAGLRPGDRLISIDGEEILTSDQVTMIISSHVAGDVIHLVFSRNQEVIELDITLYGIVPDISESTSV